MASSDENQPILVNRYAFQQSRASVERFVDMAGWLNGVESAGDAVFALIVDAPLGPAMSVSSEPWLLAASVRW